MSQVKATWLERHGSVTVQVLMHEPKARPCNRSCPYRVANHGKSRPFTYDHEVEGIPYDPICHYTLEKYEAQWDALKHGQHGQRPSAGHVQLVAGQPSCCHVARRGSGEMPLSGAFGQPVAARLVANQCTGALVLQQRELLRHVENGSSGLTRRGAARVATDMLGREVSKRALSRLDVGELLEHAHPALLDQAIGNPLLAPLSERELSEWGSRLRRRA